MESSFSPRETVSELEWTDPYPKPEWVSNGGVDTEEHLFFVGVSTKRQDERNASREASNDALLKYTEYCGVDIQYIQDIGLKVGIFVYLIKTYFSRLKHTYLTLAPLFIA